jgi:transposase
MIWACFAGCVKGPMVPLVLPLVTGKPYLSTLQHLLPSFMDFLPQDPFDLIFMHDNAPIHTSNIVKDWLSDQEFITMDWPAYLLDLNPIKHVWRELKSLLHRQHPDLKTFKGGKDRVRECLVEILPEAWDAISEDFLENLLISMPHRVQAVLDADGWYTQY